MDKVQLKQVLECLLFAANRPIPLSELVDICGENQPDIELILQEMQTELRDRKSSLQIAFIAEGVQFTILDGFNYWVKKLYKDQTTFRLSPSALETLSIIAYKQPITKAEIEQIRGVESSGVVEKLFDRRLVKIVGRKEAIGRPMLYGTTLEFLRHFNLWKISDLPSLNELALELNENLEANETQETNETLLGSNVASEISSDVASNVASEVASEVTPETSKESEPQGV